MKRLTNRLFVYGTLMQGQKRHFELAECGVQLLGQARIAARLFEIPGEDFPGAIPGPETVYGELYLMTAPRDCLRKMDEIEGCDEGLFERVLIDAYLDDHKVKAWTYFYALPIGEAMPLSRGVFRARSRN